MSQIVTEVYDAFRAARVDDALAKAAAAAIAGRDDLASKLDVERATGRLQVEIGQVKTDLQGKIDKVETGLRAEIGQVKTDLQEKIDKVESGMRAEFVRVETDLREKIDKVETDLRAEIGQIKADLKLLKFGYGPVIIGLLVKLTFFP